MQQFNFAILIIILAGLVNASYVVPTRYIQQLSYEKIWLFHTAIAFIILPWVFSLLFMPAQLLNYFNLSEEIWFYLVIGGLVFGLGQFSFAYALRFVGIALAFAVNLALAVTIGSLFVAIYQKVLWSVQGFFLGIAIFFIIMSLLLSYYAGKENALVVNKNYALGWLLASFTGLTSGVQSIIFYLLVFHRQTPFSIEHSFWVWPPFLSFAAISMLVGFFMIHKKSTVVLEKSITNPVINFFLLCLMGLFFTGSMALYSVGMSALSAPQKIIGWPAFLIAIILGSQAWSWIFRENAQQSKRVSRYKIISTLLLVLAMVLLNYVR